MTVLYYGVLLATEKDVLSYQVEMNPPDRIPTSGVRKVKARKRKKTIKNSHTAELFEHVEKLEQIKSRPIVKYVCQIQVFFYI